MGKPEPIYYYTGKELKEITYKVGSLKYLVTGTGRCGTVYMAKMLSSVGIACTHEAIFKYDGVEAALRRLAGVEPVDVSEISKLASVADEEDGILWFANQKEVEVVAEASYLAAPHIQHDCLRDATIIHVVRRPMAVINSFVAGFKYFEDWCLTTPQYEEYHSYIYKLVPRLYDRMSPVSRAALYYIEWNKMIERLSEGKRYYRHRIEQSPDKLLRFLGIEAKKYYKNDKSNHKIGLEQIYNYSHIEIPDIREQLVDLEKRYYYVPRL